MEKIVVMSSGTDQDSNLIECLRALFPECEIAIQQRIPKNDEPVSDEKEESGLDENIEKYLSFL